MRILKHPAIIPITVYDILSRKTEKHLFTNISSQNLKTLERSSNQGNVAIFQKQTEEKIVLNLNRQKVMSTNVGIESLLSDLGKATRRGTRRCPQCGKS